MFKSFFHYLGTRLLATFLSLWIAGLYCVIVHGVYLFVPGLSNSSVAPIIIVVDCITSVLIGLLMFYMQDKELSQKEQLIKTNKKDVQ